MVRELVQRRGWSLVTGLLVCSGSSLWAQDPGYDTTYQSPRSSLVTSSHIAEPGRGSGFSPAIPNRGDSDNEILARCQPIADRSQDVALAVATPDVNTQLIQITDPDGQPVENAVVRVARNVRLKRCHSYLSDDAGQALFEVLRPKRNYVVQVSAPGYYPSRIRIDGGARKIRGARHYVELVRSVAN